VASGSIDCARSTPAAAAPPQKRSLTSVADLQADLAQALAVLR
jgi:hypothetical protein